jgi:hypothetical protein
MHVHSQPPRLRAASCSCCCSLRSVTQCYIVTIQITTWAVYVNQTTSDTPGNGNRQRSIASNSMLYAFDKCEGRESCCSSLLSYDTPWQALQESTKQGQLYITMYDSSEPIQLTSTTAAYEPGWGTGL